MMQLLDTDTMTHAHLGHIEDDDWAKFRQGKKDETKKLATEAAAKMKPLPKDERNPVSGGAGQDDLILWLAYKEAKAMIQFDAAPAASKKPDGK